MRESLEWEAPRGVASRHPRVGMFPANIARDEEASNIRGTHEVGELGAGMVRVLHGTIGCFVAEYPHVRRQPVQREVASRLQDDVKFPGDPLPLNEPSRAWI